MHFDTFFLHGRKSQDPVTWKKPYQDSYRTGEIPLLVHTAQGLGLLLIILLMGLTESLADFLS